MKSFGVAAGSLLRKCAVLSECPGSVGRRRGGELPGDLAEARSPLSGDGYLSKTGEEADELSFPFTAE